MPNGAIKRQTILLLELCAGTLRANGMPKSSQMPRMCQHSWPDSKSAA